MKFLLALPLLAFCTLALSQPFHRCDRGSGVLVLQDRPCVQLTQGSPGGSAAAYDLAQAERQAGMDRLQAQQRAQEAAAAAAAAAAENQRVRLLLKGSGERRSAQHGQNRRRCETAMRIASLCGKFAGRFSCDDQGFRLLPGVVAVGESGGGARQDYMVNQCALRAAMGEDP